MKLQTTFLLALCASLTAWAIEIPKAGPQYMPEVMESIMVPFDVSGIRMPMFTNRSATVKMKGKGLSTKAIQTAIDRMSAKGGGTVVIPDGKWQTGRIELKSDVRLHLSDGAVLTFSGDIKDYQPAVLTRNEGYDVMSLGAMIYANGAENIGVTGRGHIVGPSTDCEMYVENRKYLVVEECVDIKKSIAERICDGQEGRPVLLPMMLAPVNCKNVLIEGITIDQGLFWNIVPQYCDNVIIRGVTVNSAGHGRTDGIDIESTTNSLIEYCSLDCGDDCYTIKSGRGEDGVRIARPSINVVIRHSIALRGAGGLVLGSETAANMWNVYMHDCVMDGTQQAFRVKSRRPRGGGGHDVWVERVYAKNIANNAFTVDMLGSKRWVGDLANRYPAREINELTPEFKNIHIKDITIDGCSRFIDVKALPERPLTNVLIENAEVRCKEFLRMQDAQGFVLKNAIVHTSSPSASLDGCHSVMLLDVDFEGKQLKQSTKNATLFVSGK
ncbi:MAG: glycoside hydrolase family 28 protein [Bacteroidaceae bacterium]|nr:glycoside hydrolase family 28 protein [Bacteroidaceae bacterium]